MSNDTGRRYKYTQQAIANIAWEAQFAPVVLNREACWRDLFLRKAIIEIMFGADLGHGLTVTETGDNFIITKTEVSK